MRGSYVLSPGLKSDYLLLNVCLGLCWVCACCHVYCCSVSIAFFITSSSSFTVLSALTCDLLFLFKMPSTSTLNLSLRLFRMSASYRISMYISASLFFSTAVSFCLLADLLASSCEMNLYAWCK